MTDQSTDKATAVLPGHQADSPGNASPPQDRWQARTTPPGWIAAGHQTEQAQGATGMVSMNYQALTPVPAADLASVSGHEGPLASSILEHQGRARVQMLDQMAASARYTSQVGLRAPSGIPGQPPEHTAPTGAEPVQPRPLGPAGMQYERTRQQTYRGGPVT